MVLMKQMIFLSIFVFSTLGAYVPFLFGETNFLSGWSILGGLIGGIFGIWAGVAAAKRWA